MRGGLLARELLERLVERAPGLGACLRELCELLVLWAPCSRGCSARVGRLLTRVACLLGLLATRARPARAACSQRVRPMRVLYALAVRTVFIHGLHARCMRDLLVSFALAA